MTKEYADAFVWTVCRVRSAGHDGEDVNGVIVGGQVCGLDPELVRTAVSEMCSLGMATVSDDGTVRSGGPTEVMRNRSVRMTDSDWELVRTMAAAQDTTVSDFVRKACSSFSLRT